MKWSDVNVHLFIVLGNEFSDARFAGEKGIKDESKFHLKDYAKKGKSVCYCYDFKDNWTFNISVLDDDYKFKGDFNEPYIIVAGKRSAPPEDCGGVNGYKDLTETLKNPDHPNYVHWKKFIGNDWDPEVMKSLSLGG
jgi:hypothetical protein